jgi:hypothetical protein
MGDRFSVTLNTVPPANATRSFGGAILQDIPGFRERRRSLPLAPYERLETSPRHLAMAFRQMIDDRLLCGYTRDGLTLPSLEPPIDWFAHNRSFAYHLNAWDPVTELLMGFSIYQDERYFEAARAFCSDWMENFQFLGFPIGPVPKELDAVFGATPWYDMAVGVRAYRIAYILDVLARDSRYGDEEVELYLRSLIFHLRLLSRDDFFRGHSNHGFYQAFGQLAVTRRFVDEPPFAEALGFTLDRVRAAIQQQFHPGGIHREHSPGYHYMVMGSLLGARASGLIGTDDIGDMVAQLERTMTWLIQPAGGIVTFGDTDPRDMRMRGLYADNFKNPDLQYQISAGASGSRPLRGLHVLKDEGYVFARSDYPENPSDGWWYFAQIASFHSRVHKHADDLSFVWSDRSSEILIDPARFAYAGKTEPGSDLARQGFWYSDPKRVYVESTRAHNTVEIDGRSYDRTRKPYGSALKYAGEQGELIVTECEIHHFRTVRHWRALAMSPDRFILVVDWLLDRSGETHDFRQFFQFHPSWTVETAAPGRLIAIRSQPDLSLAVVTLNPAQGTFRAVRGQQEPELLGWYSDKAYSLIPATTIFAEQLQTDYAVFATLFTFSSDVSPRPASIRKSMRPSVFCWNESDALVTVSMMRGTDDDHVSATLVRTPLDELKTNG